jgi:hypothetical protein
MFKERGGPITISTRPVRPSVTLSGNNEDALHALSSPSWEGSLSKKRLSHGRYGASASSILRGSTLSTTVISVGPVQTESSSLMIQ